MSLHGSSSQRSLHRNESGSLLSLMEIATCQQRPAEAMVKFANSIGVLAQVAPQQRLKWSRECTRLPASARADVSREPLLPKTGCSKRRCLGQAFIVQPHSARTPSAPSSGCRPTGNSHKANCTWPVFKNADGPHTRWVPTVPPLPKLSRALITPSQAKRGKACTDAGLLIIPDAILPPTETAAITVPADSEADPNEAKEWQSHSQCHDANPHSRTFPGSARPSLSSKEFRESSSAGLGLENSPRPSLWSTSLGRGERFSVVKRPSGMGSLAKERDAHLEEIAEQPNLEQRRREKRQELQQQHVHQVSQVQELVRTLQHLQPQDNTPVAEPFAMLRMMMGGAAAAEKKTMRSSTFGAGPPDKTPVAEHWADLLANSGSDRESPLLDSADVRLPSSIDTSALAPKEPSCFLAQSCSSRRLTGHSSGRKGLGDESDNSASDGSPTQRRSAAMQKFRSKVNLVRGAGRLGIVGKMAGEELDEEYESSMIGKDSITYEDVVRLSMEHNLPSDMVFRARRLFARHDKNRMGELESEEVQHVLREMYKLLHPSCTSVPPCLQMCPSTWGRARFPEVLRWLSRSAYSEEALVPHEQRQARELARQWGVSVVDVEIIKDMFERFDTDKAGYLNAANFKNALSVVLRAPKGTEVPPSRQNFHWKEIDTGNGEVSFEQFFWWYQRGGFDDTSNNHGFRSMGRNLTGSSISLCSPSNTMRSNSGFFHG